MPIRYDASTKANAVHVDGAVCGTGSSRLSRAVLPRARWGDWVRRLSMVRLRSPLVAS